MGEVNREGRISRMRRAVSRYLMPPSDLRQFQAVDELILRLQRSDGQINQLMNDVGQYREAWKNLAVGDYNPEEIGFDEYKKMLNYDAQVITGKDLIEMGVLMKPWRIVHEDEEIVNTITNAFLEMKWPNFRDCMKNMMTALTFGYSITEVVFDDYGKYWMPRLTNGLKTLDPETLQFFTDEFGNLDAIKQMMGGAEIELPKERLLIWTHEKEWGNWYGKSVLRGCYKNWYIKDAMLKFANIAYERFGSPILLGIARNKGDMTQISNVIQNLFARSQAVLRKTDKDDPTAVEVIESKRTEMPFDRYIRYHDQMILQRMLIGQKLFEGGGGTYGPKVPLDIVFMRFQDYRLELESISNELLKLITDLNWNVDKYPTFEFEPLTTMDQETIIQKIYGAVDKRIIHRREPWIREELGMPPATKEYQEKLEEEDEMGIEPEDDTTEGVE